MKNPPLPLTKAEHKQAYTVALDAVEEATRAAQSPTTQQFNDTIAGRKTLITFTWPAAPVNFDEIFQNTYDVTARAIYNARLATAEGIISEFARSKHIPLDPYISPQPSPANLMRLRVQKDKP